MENIFLLIAIGFVVGTLGTLIGAGGGFILVPILLFLYPHFKPATITAISMAIVACNAISGSIAYARAKRIDYRAGIQFAAFTIPGSILGVLATRYISKELFTIFFGSLLVILAGYLFFKKTGQQMAVKADTGKGSVHHQLTDKQGDTFSYSYNPLAGYIISLLVGFISPILGIGGGIIHVPALSNWLNFPVHIATATSHFILAVMSTVSVIVNIINGNYNDPVVLKMVIYLAIGVMGGAQLGAYLSHKIKGNVIIKALAVSLALVGVRILMENF